MEKKKTSYIYDSEACRFVPYRPSLQDTAFKATSFLVASVLIGLLSFIAYSNFYQSPYKKELQAENETISQKYSNIKKELKEQNKRIAALQKRDDFTYRSVFEAEPIPESVRMAGVGGVERFGHLQNLEESVRQEIIGLYSNIDFGRRQLYIQSKSFDELLMLAKNKENMIQSIPAIQPIAKGKYRRITSGFGYRIDPIFRVRRLHSGMDFSARRGTEIISTGDGEVEFSGYRSGYGYTVVVDHGYGYKTLYGHCSKVLVKTGEKVKRGTPIAKVGSTGKSTGMHLHYEVIRNGRKVDPINYFYNDLNEDEYELMLEMAKDAPQETHLDHQEHHEHEHHHHGATKDEHQKVGIVQ